MIANLSTRLIVRVAVPAALLFLLVMWIASQRSFRRVLEETERSSRAIARQHAEEIETVLSRATKIPEMVALTIEAVRFDDAGKLEAYLREVLARNRAIYGSCIAFEPYSFDAAKLYYAPYYYWLEEKPEFVQLGKPDYDYFKWDWYRLPKEAGRPLWSEPYFDEGGGNAMMMTYSVPFHRDGAFWGIATIDIAMSQLTAQLARVSVGNSGYAFMVSKQGRFVAHPDKSKIMRSTIQEMNPELARQMTAGEDGFLRTAEPTGGRESWIAFVPVPQGELSLAIVYPQSELLAQAMELQAELLILGLGGILVMFIALIFIARSVSRPIADLARAAQEVAAGRLEHSLSTDAPIREVRHLTFAFNKMTRDLRMRMQELSYTTTVKERLEGELSAARSIQMSLLPKVFPDRTETEIHAIVRPAREVGGDFYDFYFIDDERLCLLIGDVSGKGIPAALFMAVTKTLLKAKASLSRSPSEVLASVNRELCGEGDTGMFVTLAYALLNTRTGELELCNAGHLAPLVISSRGSVTPIAGESGAALGLLSDLEYPVTHLQLTPGETVIFFTDGITEALNPDREFYSARRLHAILCETHEEPVAAITRRVVEDVQAFCGDREQADDISMLALRWLGTLAPKTNSGVSSAAGMATVT